MAKQPLPANVNDSNKRFEDARKRYSEMNSRNVEQTSQDAGSDDHSTYNNIIDFLKKSQDRLHVPSPIINSQAVRPIQVANDNIPVPLPVKSIDEGILVSQQNSANRMLSNINDSILSGIGIPEPLKIDDSEIAHETTLQQVVNVLENILTNLQEFAEKLVEKFTAVGQNFVAGFGQFGDEVGEERGWLANKIGNMIDYLKGTSPKVESAIESMAKLFTPVTKFSKDTANYLREIYQLQLKRMKNRTQEARDLVTEDEGMPKGALAGLMHVLLPKDSAVRKFFDSIGNVAAFLKNIGQMADQKLSNSGIGSFLAAFTPATALKLGGMLLRFVTPFIGMSTFLGGVIGAAIFAPFYAMFKNPDQLLGYFEAFSTLFTEVIGPAMAWIAKEIIPPLSLAFAALLVAGDYLLDTVGTYINKTLIFILGTALPDILKLVGRSIDALWQGLKSAVMRIAGIFGLGKHSDKSIAYNLIGAFVDLADGILETMSLWVTEMLHTIGLSKMFDLKDGETVYGRMKRFFMEDIPNFAIDMFDKMMALVNKYNPIPLIQKKIESFTDMLVGMIPSWNDMKKWIVDSIPAWVNDSVRQWIIDKLGPDPEQSVPGPNGPVKESDINALRNELSGMTASPIPAQQLYDAPIGPYDRGSSFVVHAPSTTTTTTTSVSNRSGGSGARPSTRPETSPLDSVLYGGR